MRASTSPAMAAFPSLRSVFLKPSLSRSPSHLAESACQGARTCLRIRKPTAGGRRTRISAALDSASIWVSCSGLGSLDDTRSLLKRSRIITNHHLDFQELRLRIDGVRDDPWLWQLRSVDTQEVEKHCDLYLSEQERKLDLEAELKDCKGKMEMFHQITWLI